MKVIRNEGLVQLYKDEKDTGSLKAVDRYGRTLTSPSLASGAATEAKQDEIISLLSNYLVFFDETTTTDVTYVGKAAPGTATSAASWQIFVLDETGDLQVKYADGDAGFTKIWDNRASLSYS